MIAETSLALISPALNRAASLGRRSRGANAILICPEALRWLIPIAAATSAAAHAHRSTAHCWRSSSPGASARAASSPIAANRRAAVTASARVHA